MKDTTLPALAPLSNQQKATITILARMAFDQQVEAGLIEFAQGGKTKALEAFRQAEQLAAVEQASLTECTQAHYCDLCAHFFALTGKVRAALDILLKVRAADTEEAAAKQLQIFLIRQTLEAGGLHENYALAIARRKHKANSFDDLTAVQLQQLHWTVVNRTQAKKDAANGVFRPWQRNKAQRAKGNQPRPDQSNRQHNGTPWQGTTRHDE